MFGSSMYNSNRRVYNEDMTQYTMPLLLHGDYIYYLYIYIYITKLIPVDNPFVDVIMQIMQKHYMCCNGIQKWFNFEYIFY